MHRDAALVLESLGGDASDFAARQFTPRIASSADLIIAMTKRHRDDVLERTPRLLRRTFTLSEAAQLAADPNVETLDGLGAMRTHLPLAELADIADPIGEAPEVFEEVGAQIAALLPPIVDFCRRLSARSLE